MYKADEELNAIFQFLF